MAKKATNQFQLKAVTTDKLLSTFVQDAMLAYGTEVVEERAIPDYHDGCKPVHRYLLWALYKLGLHHTRAFKKSARTVGETIGKYHPHGDVGTYKAMTNLVGVMNDAGTGWESRNCTTPLIEGYGNWGSATAGPAAQRYCVIAGTRVTTEKGIIPIEDIPDWKSKEQKTKGLTKPGYRKDISLAVDTRDGEGECVSWVNSGRHKVIKISTPYGDITCTKNHPFLTPTKFLTHKWVEAGELSVGDTVVLNRNPTVVHKIQSNKPIYFSPTRSDDKNRRHTFPTTMSEELAFILGFLVAEGSVTHYSVFTNNTDKEYFDEFVRCWVSCFPRSPYKVRKCKPHGWGKKKVYTFECNSAQVIEFLSSLGLHKGDSYSRIIPDVIWTSSITEVSCFLRALFEGDGSIGKRKGNTYEYGITYHSVSTDLLKGLQLLLLTYYGIVTRKGNKTLGIVGRQNALRFKPVGFFSQRKQKVFKAVLKHIDSVDYVNHGACPFYEKLPAVFTKGLKRFKNKVNTNAGPWLKLLRGHTSKLGLAHVYAKRLPEVREILDRQNKVISRIDNIHRQDYIYATITSIESKGRQFVYDITVPKNHSFLANGFVVHNTESRLSKFSDLILLDPDYLAVVDYVDNFSGDEKVPLILPAKLPMMLLNFSEGIAVGVVASSPGFALPGVIEITKAALEGKEITPRLLYRTLKIDPPYGGTCISSKQDFYDVFNGKGSLLFQPSYVKDPAKRRVTLTSVCPGLYSASSVLTLLEKIGGLHEVAIVTDDTDKKGVRFTITLKRGQDLDKFTDKVLKMATRSQRYDIGITRRSLKRVRFQRIGIPALLKKWCAWRIRLELKVLARLLRLEEEKLSKLELFVLAVDNLDIIVQALKIRKKDKETVNVNGEKIQVDAPAAFLMRKLKITAEQAETIRDMRIRQLEAMEKVKLLEQIKETKLEIQVIKKDQKAPATRIVRHLDKMPNLV